MLVLAGCSRVSADGLRAFLAAPRVKQSLLFLDVSRCLRVTRAALMLPPTVRSACQAAPTPARLP